MLTFPIIIPWKKLFLYVKTKMLLFLFHTALLQVGPDGYFNFGTGFSRLVGPFSSTGSIPGSASYEVHRGALSQNVLSQASSIVNANGATNFYAKWVLLATWETYAENNKVSLSQQQNKYSEIDHKLVLYLQT